MVYKQNILSHCFDFVLCMEFIFLSLNIIKKVVKSLCSIKGGVLFYKVKKCCLKIIKKFCLQCS